MQILSSQTTASTTTNIEKPHLLLQQHPNKPKTSTQTRNKPKKQPEKTRVHTKGVNNYQKENSRKTLVNDGVIETEIMVISRGLHQKGLRCRAYDTIFSLGNLRIEQKAVRDSYFVCGTITDYDRQPRPHLFCSYRPSARFRIT